MEGRVVRIKSGSLLASHGVSLPNRQCRPAQQCAPLRSPLRYIRTATVTAGTSVESPTRSGPSKPRSGTHSAMERFSLLIDGEVYGPYAHVKLTPCMCPGELEVRDTRRQALHAWPTPACHSLRSSWIALVSRACARGRPRSPALSSRCIVHALVLHASRRRSSRCPCAPSSRCHWSRKRMHQSALKIQLGQWDE